MKPSRPLHQPAPPRHLHPLEPELQPEPQPGRRNGAASPYSDVLDSYHPTRRAPEQIEAGSEDDAGGDREGKQEFLDGISALDVETAFSMIEEGKQRETSGDLAGALALFDRALSALQAAGKTRPKLASRAERLRQTLQEEAAGGRGLQHSGNV